MATTELCAFIRLVDRRVHTVRVCNVQLPVYSLEKNRKQQSAGISSSMCVCGAK